MWLQVCTAQKKWNCWKVTGLDSCTVSGLGDNQLYLLMCFPFIWKVFHSLLWSCIYIYIHLFVDVFLWIWNIIHLVRSKLLIRVWLNSFCRWFWYQFFQNVPIRSRKCVFVTSFFRNPKKKNQSWTPGNSVEHIIELPSWKHVFGNWGVLSCYYP